MIVVGIFTYQNWISLLMIAAVALNTVSFSFTEPKLVRTTILISSPLLLVYNILTGSIGGVINELFTEISSVVGIIRYDIKKKDKTTQVKRHLMRLVRCLLVLFCHYFIFSAKYLSDKVQNLFIISISCGSYGLWLGRYRSWNHFVKSHLKFGFFS